MGSSEDREQATLLDLESQVNVYQGDKAVRYQDEEVPTAQGLPEYGPFAVDDYADPSVRARMEGDTCGFPGANQMMRVQTFYPLVKGALLLTGIIVGMIFGVLAGVCGIIYAVAKIVEGIGKAVAAGPEFLWMMSSKALKGVQNRWAHRHAGTGIQGRFLWKRNR